MSNKPLKILSNRVWRTYTGGKLIEEWQSKKNTKDNNFPEEWVASTVLARNAGREHITDEGLSKTKLENGREITLKEAIDSEPERFLGKKHAEKYGKNPAVLVKILDAKERLAIQVHPDKKYAKEAFDSDFGKTEAWYILGGRNIDGEEPYVMLGFKPGVTRDKWIKLFQEQDIEGMLSCLHRIPVKEGEVYLLEGGVPHAIGSGCFMVEIQEPTDYTLRVERTTPQGYHLPDLSCHQGVGFEKMFDCFHYDSFSYEETLKRWKLEPRVLRQGFGGQETVLIDNTYTDRFRMDYLIVLTQLECCSSDEFYIAIVVSGQGKLRSSDGEIEVTKSDQLFIPAGVGDVKWINIGTQEMKIVICRPPE